MKSIHIALLANAQEDYPHEEDIFREQLRAEFHQGFGPELVLSDSEFYLEHWEELFFDKWQKSFCQNLVTFRRFI